MDNSELFHILQINLICPFLWNNKLNEDGLHDLLKVTEIISGRVHISFLNIGRELGFCFFLSQCEPFIFIPVILGHL